MMATALREVLARFGVSFDDKELKKGDKAVDGVADKLASLGKMLVAGAVVHGVSNFITSLADQANALKDQSAVLGMSTDQLQKWQYVASLSGMSAESMTTSLGKLQKSIAMASDGTGPAADAFRGLKVPLKDANGQLRNVNAVFDDAVGAIGAIKNPTERAAASMALFGNAGAQMTSLFEQGADGIARLRKEADDLGGGFSPEFAERAADMNDAITRLNFAWLSFKVRVGGVVLPLITRFMTTVTKATAFVSKWVDKTKLLSDSSNLAAAAAVVLGTAFMVAGIKAIAPWLPMIATFAALILLADELITLWQGGDTLIGRAIDSIFGEGSSKKAVDWLKGVVAENVAFFSDLEKGWSDFRTALELIWFDLTTALSQGWTNFAAGVELILHDMVTSVRGAVADIQDSFGEMLDKVPGASKVLGKFSTGNRAAIDAEGAKGRSAILAKTDVNQAAIDAKRLAIVRAGDDRIAASRATTVNAPTEINITVPPGTSAQQARAVGEAARKGSQSSNKAMFNTLVKTAG